MAFDDPFNSNSPNLDEAENNGNDFYNYNDEDPAAEFLEREKRELAEITGDSDINSFNDPFNTESLNDNQANYLSNGKIFLLDFFFRIRKIDSFRFTNTSQSNQWCSSIRCFLANE